MRMKHRALSILLSLVMVLTFMPAMALAEDETEPWWTAESVPPDGEVYLNELGEAYLTINVNYGGYDAGSEPLFYYEWYESGPDDTPFDITYENSVTVYRPGFYQCFVFDKNSDDPYNYRIVNFWVHVDGDWEVDYMPNVLLVNGKATLDFEIDEYNGFKGDYSYVWLKWNDVKEDFIRINGAYEKTLTVSKAGEYRCLITESTTGQEYEATFYVNSWFAYSKEYWVELLLGGTATMELTFEGEVPDNLTYQWYDANENAIDGATSDNCTVDTAGDYYCRVYYGSGDSDYVDVGFYVEQLNRTWRAYSKNNEEVVELKIGKTAPLEVILEGAYDESEISYQWFTGEDFEDAEPISGETDSTYIATKSGDYICEVTEESSGESVIIHFWVSNERINENGVVYYLVDDHSVAVMAETQVSGPVAVKSSVKFSDGKTYPVTIIDDFSFCDKITSVTLPSTATTISDDAFINTTLKSITIPASVTHIGEHALGYNWDTSDSGAVYTKVAGFTIFGKTGSAAEAYAKANGFTFRDPAAEEAARKAAEADAKARAAEADAKARAAEAERQGVQASGMPKMKFKKTTAKKSSIKVQWAKLDKKKVKKSKTSKIEIWVSTSSAFPKEQTIEKKVGKNKTSVNIKGLKKNTKYYVKIRTIKYVGGKKMTGPWKQKTVKTKKKKSHVFCRNNQSDRFRPLSDQRLFCCL